MQMKMSIYWGGIGDWIKKSETIFHKNNNVELNFYLLRPASNASPRKELVHISPAFFEQQQDPNPYPTYTHN
jgi:hypothetical protein